MAKEEREVREAAIAIGALPSRAQQRCLDRLRAQYDVLYCAGMDLTLVFNLYS